MSSGDNPAGYDVAMNLLVIRGIIGEKDDTVKHGVCALLNRVEHLREALEPIRAVHDQFRHLSPVLTEAAQNDDPFHRAAAALWQAVSAAVARAAIERMNTGDAEKRERERHEGGKAT